jgi:hypothetical protein
MPRFQTVACFVARKSQEKSFNLRLHFHINELKEDGLLIYDKQFSIIVNNHYKSAEMQTGSGLKFF